MFSAKATILIVTFNGEKWVDKCLRSCTQAYGDYHILVIDNASADATLAIARQYPIEVIEMNENIGFGRANNYGISYIIRNRISQYIFLLNQDAYIVPNTISQLVDTIKVEPNIGILSPMHMDGTGSTLDHRFAIYHRRGKKYISNHGNELLETKFVNAAAWMMDVNVLKQVGGFDPVFRHTGEDDNLCQRVLYHDYKVLIDTGACIWHDRQKRPKEAMLPFKRVATRARIWLYDITVNPLRKWVELIQLIAKFLFNLLLPQYYKFNSLRTIWKELQSLLAYRSQYKRNYETKGIFLDI